MRLFELLLEDRYESLYNKYKDKITSRAKQDHSLKWKKIDDLLFKIKYLENEFGKYVEWVLLKWLQGNFLYEDLNRVKTAITQFEEKKRALEKKDINQYKSLSDLEDAVGLLDDVKSSRQIKQEIKNEGIKKIYEDSNYLLAQLLTEQAACFYGSNTKWCTAAKEDNAFVHYSDLGPLYIIIDKKENRKYQLSYDASQVMDELDNPVNYLDLKKQYPALSKIEPTIDEIISHTPDTMYYFIKTFYNGKRLPEVEDKIVNNPEFAFEYAKFIINGRWPEAEPSFKKSRYFSSLYASAVMKQRWPEIEDNLKQDEHVWNRYKERFNIEG
jgi:hypothetical protein